MNVSLRRAACSLVVLLGSAALLVAQQVQPPAQPRVGQPRVQQPGQPVLPGQPGQLRPGQPGAQPQQLEQSILTLLIIDNNKEIALGRLAQQTSDNEHVKHFAEMIVKDHSDFVQKLQERTAAAGRAPRLGTATGVDQPIAQPARPLAQPRPGEARRDAATQPRREAQRDQDQEDRTAADQQRDLSEDRQEARTAITEQRQETRTADQDREGLQGQPQRVTVARPVIGQQPGSELLQLQQEVAEASLERARRDAQKHGEEFDKHFMGAQIVLHQHMLDKLQVFERHVSPQTRQLLAEARETTEKHLEEAKNIHEQVSGQPGRQPTRRTEPQQNRQ